MSRTAVLLLALVLAGCGGGGRAHGTATLWVTEGRGARVVWSGPVPAGLNGIQTVAREVKVSTRYGGRFVQSIAGVGSSLSKQRDWFFYVDGVEGGESAASVRLKPGDVLWWDYRHWSGATMDIPVVAGAYPQPFLRAGPTTVVGDPAVAKPIARQVHGTANGTAAARSRIVIGGALAPGAVHIAKHGDGYELDLGTAVARRLAHDPAALRYRF